MDVSYHIRRENVLLKNIFSVGLLKGISALSGFWLIRVSFNYIRSNELYGIWITILSILSWINLFDIGLGNGLRNKLSEALANKKYIEGRYLVSTSYLIMTSLVMIFMLMFLIISRFINWNILLNIKSVSTTSLDIFMNTVIIGYLVSFGFTLINSVSYAFQNPKIANLLQSIANVLICIILILLNHFKLYNKLTTIGFVYILCNIIVFLFGNIFLFSFSYKSIKPSIKFINLKLIKSLFGISLKFFVIQICSVIIFSTDSFIITRVLGPSEATPYQLVVKLFSIFTIIMGIITTPLWSAYTNALCLQDFKWMKRIFTNNLLLLIPIGILMFAFTFIAKIVIRFWIGQKIIIDNSLIVVVASYTFVLVWINIFSYFLNGINKVNQQMIFMTIGAVINIPLSIYFCTVLRLGAKGIVLGSIIALLFYAVAAPFEVFRFFKMQTDIPLNSTQINFKRTR